MIKFLVSVAAVAFLNMNSANAVVQKAPDNGNQMVKLCTSEKGGTAEATCQGFLSGVIAATNTYATAKQLKPTFCVPKGTPQTDIVAAFTTYVEENQALNHFPAGILAISAFIQTFPCDQAGQP
jgi:hypothetical protein